MQIRNERKGVRVEKRQKVRKCNVNACDLTGEAGVGVSVCLRKRGGRQREKETEREGEGDRQTDSEKATDKEGDMGETDREGEKSAMLMSCDLTGGACQFRWEIIFCNPQG